MAENIKQTGVQPPQDNDLKALMQRITQLERTVVRLKNNRGPTVPQYDPDNFPAQSVQGQIAIAHPSSANPKTAHAYDSVNGWWQIGGADPPHSVSLGMTWGASSGFYSFPSNQDGVSLSRIYYVRGDADFYYDHFSAGFQALGGGIINFVGTNTDTEDRIISNLFTTVQDMASSTRQVLLHIGDQTLVASYNTAIELETTGAVGALVDTTSSPATWVSTGRYVVTVGYNLR